MFCRKSTPLSPRLQEAREAVQTLLAGLFAVAERVCQGRSLEGLTLSDFDSHLRAIKPVIDDLEATHPQSLMVGQVRGKSVAECVACLAWRVKNRWDDAAQLRLLVCDLDFERLDQDLDLEFLRATTRPCGASATVGSVQDHKKDIPLLSGAKKKPRAKNIEKRMYEHVQKIGTEKAVLITKDKWSEILNCSPSGAQRVPTYRRLQEEARRLRASGGRQGGIVKTPLGSAEVCAEVMDVLTGDDEKFGNDESYDVRGLSGMQKCGGGRRKKRHRS
jgi:hypothetical protein